MMPVDTSNSVLYHHGKFPPAQLDYTKLIQPLTKATTALSRYDQMLRNLHNSAILLVPLRHQEAVFTSRMEGTISTLDEILEYDAQGDDKITNVRDEAIETFLYAHSLNKTQKAMQDGQELSDFLLRQAHQALLSLGRGVDKNPGQFKTEQNYLTDGIRSNVSFTPIAPEHLQGGLDTLFHYIKNDRQIPLIKVALAHVEFEALHPFKDGNGRIGRMLITLMLWSYGLISEPHFYMSHYLEKNKDLYINRMLDVSRNDNWDDWCVFFFNAVEEQAIKNLEITEKILCLYNQMKDLFSQALSSKWSVQVLDVMFINPIFKNNTLTRISGVSKQSANRFAHVLLKKELIKIIREPSGSRGAMYSFEPLLELVRV